VKVLKIILAMPSLTGSPNILIEWQAVTP